MRIRSGERPAIPSDFWRWNLLIWSGLGLFNLAIRYLAYHDAERALIFTLLVEPLGFLLAAALFQVYRFSLFHDPLRLRPILAVAGLTFAMAMVQVAVAVGWMHQFGLFTPGWTLFDEWTKRLIYLWMVALVWSLAFFTWRSRREASEGQKSARQSREEAQRSELRLLRAQLNPHFLFNSLNSIASEIPSHPDQALEMVHELSDYLRYSLDQRHQNLVPLASELDALEAYLRIEKIRFGDRLKFKVTANEEARSRLIPCFLLQPLVENAMKHGIQGRETEVEVEGRCRNESLHITVFNPGKLPEGGALAEGVGLETIRRRLGLHYPGKASFELKENDGRVRAELILEGEPCCG